MVALTIPPSGTLRLIPRFLLVLLTFALGLACGWLVQRRWSIVGIPLIYIVSVWSARMLTCSQCVGPSAGIGIVRAGYYGILGLTPIIFGVLLGASQAFGRANIRTD
jgi:hypothetical protein